MGNNNVTKYQVRWDAHYPTSEGLVRRCERSSVFIALRAADAGVSALVLAAEIGDSRALWKEHGIIVENIRVVELNEAVVFEVV